MLNRPVPQTTEIYDRNGTLLAELIDPNVGRRVLVNLDQLPPNLVNATIAVFTIGLMHVLVAWLKVRSVAFRKIVEGTPIVMRHGGDWNEEGLRRSRLHVDDVMAAAREKGILREEQIDYAIFERSGTICVVPLKD